MVSYNDAELLGMLHDLESDHVERKESFRGDAPTAVREAVCAFANDLPDYRVPGVVFVGVRNDGSPAGLQITDELLRQLADIKTDGNIVPPPTMTVTKRLLGSADVAVITVAPSDSPPVRYRGRIWIRIGPRRGIATPQDERILNEKRRRHLLPFDVSPFPPATLSDLDVVRFRAEYLPAAFAPDVLAGNERTVEQQLAVTKMIVSADEPTATVLGLLVLGIATRDFLPGAYIQFLRLDGRELADRIVDEQVIDGPLADVLRRIDDKLEAHNRTAVEITGDAREIRRSDYPMAALQQYVRNAVMHRTYEGSNMPVRIYWYGDRIEITSPGGPFGAVSVENFGWPGVADYRNPNLAEALKVLGFVQRFGVGLAIAQRALERNGNPPAEFVVEPGHIGVIVRSAT
jgi:ATP-dependent DNA helicase RecG